MKATVAEQILALLKYGPLFDDEVAEKLPEVSPNTIRRVRRELVIGGKIEPVGTGRTVPYKRTEATA